MPTPAKPLSLKLTAGNPGHERLPEPIRIGDAAPPTPPRPPKSLGKPGRDLWRHLWKAGANWLSPETDAGIMTRLCEGYEERYELKRIIAADGRFVVGSRGQLVHHPAVKQLHALDEQITRLESLCGFTPSDRMRLGIAKVRGSSLLMEFMAGARH